MNSRVSINGKPYRAFIDPKVDLAAAKWHHFRHNEWILPSPVENSKAQAPNSKN
ncbi:MAG: HTTM domain-containing protein [Pricia sp.]